MSDFSKLDDATSDYLAAHVLWEAMKAKYGNLQSDLHKAERAKNERDVFFIKGEIAQCEAALVRLKVKYDEATNHLRGVETAIMTGGLIVPISQNVKRGTMQVVIKQGGRSVTRHLKRSGDQWMGHSLARIGFIAYPVKKAEALEQAA